MTMYSQLNRPELEQITEELAKGCEKLQSQLTATTRANNDARMEIRLLGGTVAGLRDALEKIAGPEWIGHAREVAKQALSQPPQQEQPGGENLKEFARIVISTVCWAIDDPDGYDLEKLAEKLGLIERHIVTADEADGDFEPGDPKSVFTDVLKEKS